MTTEEYTEKFKNIVSESEKKKEELRKEYAFSNNPYKINDIICDKNGKIRIQRIRYVDGFEKNKPTECAYYGIELTPTGRIKRGYHKRNVYQSNILQESEDVSKA